MITKTYEAPDYYVAKITGDEPTTPETELAIAKEAKNLIDKLKENGFELCTIEFDERRSGIVGVTLDLSNPKEAQVEID